ncbi:preprotein translocase [Paenibacillus popilliae ATCC 14706]|uniref:Protein-export membrane protein SecG n=1 Tax=Paenibacillus popilliae ATCC 14706 TaxID=1212764 RepID=M9LI04_PAEPP|nr:preprotein translocase [Paenibacillus popilliae ATCC 14706]
MSAQCDCLLSHSDIISEQLWDDIITEEQQKPVKVLAFWLVLCYNNIAVFMQNNVFEGVIALEVEVVEVFLKILLVIFSIGLIGIVLLQKGKSAGLSGAISGGAEHLFGKQKARGLELFMQRATMVTAAGFMVVSIIVAYLGTK